MHFGVCAVARPALFVRPPGNPSRRRGQGGTFPVRLALGLLLACLLAATSSGAEQQPDALAVQREIAETRAIAAEVSKAVRRVQAENLKLPKSLDTEVRNLTAEDVTATTLRLARLDADTARLYVTTLENRIAQREAALRLLGQA
jgi:hypothetical protein